jgi:peptidoglycan-associated lipoprotein
MKSGTRISCILLLAIGSLSAFRAQAQPSASSPQPSRFNLAVGYSYEHSNAPPGGCGCFSLNGGSLSAAWPIRSSGFALAGDIGATHAGSIGSSGDSLTLSSYTAGVRYTPHFRSAIRPFGQTLVGVAHASGSLVQGSNPAASNAGAAFAALLGGGADLNAGKRFAIRLVEADYLLTTFDNSGNNHQNNLRILAGLVVRF